MTKHTPGLWKVLEHKHPNSVKVMCGNHRRPAIAVSYGTTKDNIPNYGTKDEAEANAELIARAPELLAENEELKVRIAELEAAQAWQPIETAPKEWTEILVLDRGAISIACHDSKKWVALADGKMRVSAVEYIEYDDFMELMPTHWMPLPKIEDK